MPRRRPQVGTGPHRVDRPRGCTLRAADRRWTGRGRGHRRAPAPAPAPGGTMGIDDLKDKAEGAASSGQGEKASDAGLDKAGDAASKATGGSHDEQIDKAEKSADERIGNA